MDDEECWALLDWLTANYRGVRAWRAAGRFPTVDTDALLEQAVSTSPDPKRDPGGHDAHWRAVESRVRDYVVQGLIFNAEGATPEGLLLVSMQKRKDEEGVLAILSLAAYFGEQKTPVRYAAAMYLLAAELSFFRKNFALSQAYLAHVCEVYGDRPEPWAREMAVAAARAGMVYESGNLVEFFNAMDVLKVHGQPFLDLVKTLPAFQQPMDEFLRPMTAPAAPSRPAPPPPVQPRPVARPAPVAQPRRVRVAWPVLIFAGAIVIAVLLLIATRVGVRDEVAIPDTSFTIGTVATETQATVTNVVSESPPPPVTITDPGSIGAPEEPQLVTLGRQLFPSAASLSIVPPVPMTFEGIGAVYGAPVLLNVDDELRYLELVGENGSWAVRRYAAPPTFTEDDAMRFLARNYGGSFLGLRSGDQAGEYMIRANIGTGSPTELCVAWDADRWRECEAVYDNPEIP